MSSENFMELLHYSRMNSPIGRLSLGMSAKGLAVLTFGQNLPPKLSGRAVEWIESTQATAETQQQLEEYFAGKRHEFTMPLDLRGTEFQRDCWQELLHIPYGETRSYGEI